MKKIIIYMLTIATVMAGCQKKSDDLIQNQTVDERLNAALAKYQSILTKAPYGWKLVEKSGIAFNNGASDSAKTNFTYYMQFTDSNRVKMYSSFDTVQARVPKTSGYRLSALQRPTLLFDTYGYIHVPCDPDPAVSKSPLDPGSGWGTDFEFMFADNVAPDQLGDTIHLVGLKNSATAFMVKATQAEKAILESGQYPANLAAVKSKFLTYWQRFTLGSVTYELPAIDFDSKTLTLNWLDASGNQQTFRTQFWMDFDGSLIFEQPFTTGSITVRSFSAALKLAGTNVPDNISITPAIKPLKLDMTAAQKWYAQMNLNSNGCWTSTRGFHVNGVDDFCKFSSVPGYYDFWIAGAGVFGTNPYDGFAMRYTDNFLHSPYFVSNRPVTINAGLARFTFYGSTSDFTGTSPAVQAMTAAGKIIFGNGIVLGGYFFGLGTQDWYLIPTSDDGKKYDMVRFSDALAWISWKPK